MNACVRIFQTSIFFANDVIPRTQLNFHFFVILARLASVQGSDQAMGTKSDLYFVRITTRSCLRTKFMAQVNSIFEMYILTETAGEQTVLLKLAPSGKILF